MWSVVLHTSQKHNILNTSITILYRITILYYIIYYIIYYYYIMLIYYHPFKWILSCRFSPTTTVGWTSSPTGRGRDRHEQVNYSERLNLRRDHLILRDHQCDCVDVLSINRWSDLHACPPLYVIIDQPDQTRTGPGQSCFYHFVIISSDSP